MSDESFVTPQPEPEQQMALPVLDIELTQVPIGVLRAAEGDDRGILIGPFAVRIMLPLNGEQARNVARELAGGIEIASGVGAADIAAAAARVVQR